MAGGDLEDMSRQILADFILQFKGTMECIRNDDKMHASQRVELLTSLADSFNKAVAANRKMLPETSELAVAFKVLGLLSKYIQEHKPDLLPEFVAVLEPFGEAIARELK